MSEEKDNPGNYDNLTPLEAFYRFGARSPIPDITEKTLGLISGSIHESMVALRRGPAGALLHAFTSAPGFVQELTRDTQATFYDDLSDEDGQIRTDQLDDIYAGMDSVWEIYFRNSPGLSLNIHKLEDPADVETLHLIIESKPFESLDKVPDIPGNHPHLKRLIETLSYEYGQQDEIITKRYQQGAKIGFWILKSFWYKLDPAKHHPGRD